MQRQERTILLEWTVRGYPTQSSIIVTGTSEAELVARFLYRPWQEGPDLPVAIDCFEICNGEKVKTRHYQGQTQ